MAEENLSNAEQNKKSQAADDAESSVSRQEQALKSHEGGELARPAEPQEKGDPDADATVGRAEQETKSTGGTETVGASEETVKRGAGAEGGETVRAMEEESKSGPGPDAESIFQRKEAAEK